MSIYKRGKIWWYAITVNGELVRESTKQKNKKRAEEMFAEIVTSIRTGHFVPEDEREATIPRPFDIVVESYLEDRERRGKRADSYRKLADWKAVFGSRDVQGITLEDVETQLATWTDERSWSPATYNNALAQVSGVFTYGYRRGWIDRHPIRQRAERLTVHNERQRWLRTVEVEAIQAAALDVAAKKTPDAPRDWLANLIAVAVATGVRRGKLCEMHCADVERDEHGGLSLFIGRDKNGEPVHKRVLGGLLAIVKRRLKGRTPGAFLFPGPRDGNAYTSLARFLPLAVRLAGMRNPSLGLRWGRKHRDGITFHTFRHSMASLAANNGVPLDVVQTMGNWKTATMMRRYAHQADDRLHDGEERLAEVLHITSQSPDGQPKRGVKSA